VTVMTDTLNTTTTKPAEPVTPLELLWRRSRTERDQLRLLRVWQDELRQVPPGAVLTPEATALNLTWLKRFRGHRNKQWREAGGVQTLPDVALVPCQDCGCIHPSRAPRFPGVCPECGDHGPRRPPPPKPDDIQMYSRGFHKKGPSGPSWGYSHLCVHPKCVELFLADRSDEDYCPRHKGRRVEAQRLAKRLAPKHERFRFVADEPVGFTYHVKDGRERFCLVDAQGYIATDAEEFKALLEQSMIPHLMIRAEPT
jgi:hypothetical protein